MAILIKLGDKWEFEANELITFSSVNFYFHCVVDQKTIIFADF